MTETKIVSADVAGVEEAITFVEGYLSMHGIKKKTLRRVALTVEESVSSLAAHAHPQSEIRIWLRSFLGKVTIELTSKGEEYSLVESADIAGSIGDEASDHAQEMLRNIMLTSLADDLKYRHKNGINHVCRRRVGNRRLLSVPARAANKCRASSGGRDLHHIPEDRRIDLGE